MKVIPFDADGHLSVETLLPWYAGGRLDAGERAEVEAHLAGCARCRAELELERELRALLAQPMPAPAPAEIERGLASLRGRIDPVAPTRRPWWRWVLAAQFALIGLLLAALVTPSLEGERYRALGNPGGAGAAANAVVQFGPEASEAQIRGALRESGARLVGGPTATHAYLLVLPANDAAALARLRAQPGVTLAESLEAGALP